MNSQLEFEKMVAEALRMQPATAAMQTRTRRKARVEAVPPERFAVILLRSMTEENISFATYAVMMALNAHATPPSMARLAIETGYSYHAVHKMVERTPWFHRRHEDLVRLVLTPEAKHKLLRISKRVARHSCEPFQP